MSSTFPGGGGACCDEAAFNKPCEAARAAEA
jgi:hypothetical protein